MFLAKGFLSFLMHNNLFEEVAKFRAAAECGQKL